MRLRARDPRWCVPRVRRAGAAPEKDQEACQTEEAGLGQHEQIDVVHPLRHAHVHHLPDVGLEELHHGDVLAQLDKPLKRDEPIETWDQLHKELLQSGLELVVKVEARPSRFAGGRPCSIRDAITWLLGGHRADATVVPTDKAIIIMSRREALSYWRRRLEEL